MNLQNIDQTTLVIFGVIVLLIILMIILWRKGSEKHIKTETTKLKD